MPEAWGGAAYKFPWGLKLGTHVDYTGRQFSDYYNYPLSTYDASHGLNAGGSAVFTNIRIDGSV